MGGQGQSADNEQAKALKNLLAFWADAGVAASYQETPANRLAEPARPKIAPAPPRPAQTLSPAARTVSDADVAAAVAEASELAKAAQTLEALAEAIAGFDGCPLKFDGAKQSVFARGNPEGPVMIIGEGPGADEDRQGQPFVGRAGQLLDKMIAAAGLTDRVYITNTVYWRPPGNRTPTRAEQAVCRPFLEQAIRLAKPRFLLLAGGASAKSVLNKDEGILSLRGRWFEWTDEDKTLVVPTLPTLHPAFLLRQPAVKKLAWADLLTLVDRLDRPERSS